MKPALPQGTRDFDSVTLRKRYFIFDTIKAIFELHGFEPLETPAFEYLETLTGKYGDEGDKLIFKILNNGLNNPLKKDKFKAHFENILSGKNDKEITERALRYDLTIPFARFVALNYGKLNFPYKRYQMQPVWRADRPQKGRYREFYQCDADIVGSYSLLNDAELANIYSEVFIRLNIPVSININNRKILTALSQVCGVPEKMLVITMCIDKLDKIGLDNVKQELEKEGLTKDQISTISNYLQITGNNKEVIDMARLFFNSSDVGLSGLQELETVLGYFDSSACKVDLTLARGLNYYTGIIYEVQSKNVRIGSIGGGGRYDNLTGLFGVKDIPGVGISFGVDRIYDVMEELDLFPVKIHIGPTALFFNMGENEVRTALKHSILLRNAGISCEVYHEPSKMDKQFKYATRKKFTYIIIIGDKEIDANVCEVKDLRDGSQQKINLHELGKYFLKKDI